MSKLLTTKDAAQSITQIITESKSIAVLVSPFADPGEEHLNAIREACRAGKKIYLVCRTSELKYSVKNVLEKINGLELVNHESIHAKCYFNEEKYLLSSLNLYDYSVQNNLEFGYLFNIKSSPDQFLNLMNDTVTSLNDPRINKEISALFGKSSMKVFSDRAVFEKSKGLFSFKPIKTEQAKCIRCKTLLPVMNGKYPFCEPCFYAWAQTCNYENHEQYCHWCGKSAGELDYPVTKKRPLCRTCFGKYKEHIGLNTKGNAHAEKESVGVNLTGEGMQQTEPQTPKAKRLIFRIVVAFLILTIPAAFLFRNYLQTNPSAGAFSSDETQLKQVLRNYFAEASSAEMKIEPFLAPVVSDYFGNKNLDPSHIIRLLNESRKEFSYPSTTVLDSAFKLTELKNGNRKVVYWTNYSCYRKSKSQYQYCTVKHEAEFNADNKIVSLKEMDVRNLRFSFQMEK